MADPVYFSKVKLLDGTVAEVYDEVAREAIKGGTHFLGVTSTTISDGSSTNPITIGGESVTAVNGDIVVSGNKEFIFASYDSKWHELGDTTGLGALALKDSVSAVYTPAGTVSKPDITVTPTAVGIKEISADGSVTTGTVKEISAEGSVTSGTIKEILADGSVTNGTIKEFSADGSVTTGTVKELSADGSVVAGTANTPTAVTLPVLTTTLNGTTLELSWSAGSVVAGTAGTPTAVTLPTFKDTSVVTAATMPTSKETSVVTAATMPTSKETSVITAATMPTTKETSVVTAATMPTSKETSVLTGVAAELSAAPEFSGTQSTIVSE